MTDIAAGIAAGDTAKRGFFVRTVQGGVIRCLFDVLKDLLTDVVLLVNDDGIKITTMDNSRCILVHMKLDAETFEEYRCDASYKIGVNTSNLFKLIQISGGRDAVSFSYDEATPYELGITIQNFDRNSSTTFSLKLIDMDYDEIGELDDIDFESKVTMPSKYFQKICRDMSDISNVMRIHSRDGVITLGCDGDFASQRTVLGATEDQCTMDWAEGAVFDAEFSIKYLLMICKSTGLCPTVELFLKDGYPLVVVYKIAALGTLKICLVSRLAD